MSLVLNPEYSFKGELPGEVLIAFESHVGKIIDSNPLFDSGIADRETALLELPGVLATLRETVPLQLQPYVTSKRVRQLILARLSFPKNQRR